MKNRIVIFTPTYNRPENISNLFTTLQKQTDKDFVWLIVDDGSSIDYSLAIKEIKENADFLVIYNRKENGGKHAAINFAFDRLDTNDFVIVVDDDEYLYPDAVTTARSYAAKYIDSEVGIINFTRNDINGKPIANPYIDYDYMMSGEERWRRKYHSDGYIAYYMKSVGDCRFPIFEGEKFMGESVLVGLITEHCTILWASKTLGKTSYLEGGLTNSGRMLRLKSPRGMAVYSMIVQSGNCGIKNKVKYASSYFAYLKYARIDERSFHKAWKYNLYMPFFSKILSSIIVLYWRFKYGDLYNS